MNKDEIGGNWKQFKGKAKEQWGKLTDDDMTVPRPARPVAGADLASSLETRHMV